MALLTPLIKMVVASIDGVGYRAKLTMITLMEKKEALEMFLPKETISTASVGKNRYKKLHPILMLSHQIQG
nr:MAG TPA: hypothetical protein [Bacteriophage sp.]